MKLIWELQLCLWLSLEMRVHVKMKSDYLKCVVMFCHISSVRHEGGTKNDLIIRSDNESSSEF